MSDMNPYEFRQPNGGQKTENGRQRTEDSKPTSVTVFGILNCVFGGLGILCMPCAIYGFMVAGQITQMEMTYFNKVWGLITFAAGFIFSIWQLSLGIGLLRFAAWARRGSVVYSVVVIIWVVFGNGLNILALSMGWITMPEGGIGGYVGGICGGFIGLIYPILLLIFMQTEKVKQAFAAVGG